jgi:hypothetical protein
MHNYTFIVTKNKITYHIDSYDIAYKFAIQESENTIPPHNWHVMMKYPLLTTLDSVAWGSKILVAYREDINKRYTETEIYIEKIDNNLLKSSDIVLLS